MYTTNRQGWVVTRPLNNSSTRSSNSHSQSSSRPAPAKPKVTAVRDYFATNLQIHYRLVRVGETTGARLTRTPSSKSPALRVLVNGSHLSLEPNDVIYRLDSLPIRNTADVLGHYSQTTITFLDHRTGRVFNGVITLPETDSPQISYARKR